jgi:hypothetical protein
VFIYTLVLKTNAGATNSGWNLVGNPYPAPIDWDLAYALNSANVQGGIVRRAATGTYSGMWAYYLANTPASGTNGATNQIAGMQGFFVRATSNANLTFNNSIRATSYTNSQFFRTESTLELMRLELKGSKMADETTIYFGGKTTENFEAHGDVWKAQLNSMPAPNVFTKIEDKNYAINGLGELTSERIVPVHFIAAEAGKHTFKINHIDGFDGVTVYLEDKELNILHEITKTAYTFTAAKGQNDTRFQIRFAVGNERAKDIAVTLYPNPASTNVKIQLSKAIEANISVVDMLGRKVMEISSQTREVNLDIKALPKGVYVVEILTSEGMKSVKFVKE